MLTSSDFNRRCDRLFDSMKQRFRTRYWKTGKRAGHVRTPGRNLPFDRNDLRVFLAREIGLCAKSCPYCGTVIDILSLEIDHKTPAKSRGGGLGFDNLECVCESCNRQKGELTVDEFISLRTFLATMHPAAQADIRKRLKGASRFFPTAKKKSELEEAF